MVQKLSLRPFTIFLVDGLGALLTALLLVGLLSNFEALFGIPRPISKQLACIAGLFALYSLGCFFIGPKNWKPYLFAIMIANLLYCVITLSLCVMQPITVLGWAYFLGEIMVICSLVFLEWQLLRSVA